MVPPPRRRRRSEPVREHPATGHAFGASVERALVVGCDAYVVKPCLPEDLFREVCRLRERSPGRRAPGLTGPAGG